MELTMLDQTQTSRPPSLSGFWWDAIRSLRPAFSRLSSFLWFATIVAGLTVRTELAGVTSIVRALNLRPQFYNKLLDNFHSSALKLDRLSALWVQAVLHLFPLPLRVNGRLVLVGDGIKIGKRGKKMPAVKLLHQQSESNTKPEYIMGHPCRPSACSCGQLKVFSRCRSPRVFTRVWFGPIVTGAPCSTKCWPCSASWTSRTLAISSPMRTTLRIRW